MVLFVAALSLAPAVLGATGATAADDFVKGSGDAKGSIVRTGPITGRLDFTVSVGQSFADFVGSSARSQSRSVDLGLLGLLVTHHQCNGDPYVVNPKYTDPLTLRLDSTDPDAASGRSQQTAGPFGHQEVLATSDPRARTVTTLTDFAVTGLFSIAGGRSEATAGVLGRRAREAIVLTEVARVTLLGGAVELRGLRWEAVQRTKPDGTIEVTKGTFTIAAASIAGQPVPIGGRSVDDVLDQINKAIAYTGLVLDPPKYTVTRGEVSMSPLSLRDFDSKLAAVTVRPVVAAAYPVRKPIADTIVSLECRAAIPIAVADLTIDGLAGTGGAILEIGGGAVATEAARYANPFDVRGGLGLGPPPGLTSPSVLPPADFAATLPAIGGGVVGTPAAGLSPGEVGLDAASRLGSLPGGRGGAALLAGLLGLLGVAVIAIVDYVLMRRGRGAVGA